VKAKARIHLRRLRGEGVLVAGVGLEGVEGGVDLSGAGNGVGGGHRGDVGGVGEDDVGEALDLLGKGELAVGEGNKGGTETVVNGGRDGAGHGGGRLGVGQRDLGAGSGLADGETRGEEEGGGGLDGERWASGARGDELGGKGIDHVEAKGGVVGSSPVSLGEDGAGPEALVAGLGGEDSTGDGGVEGLSDILVGADVGRDTDVLEEGREGDEGLDVGEGEGVLARGDGLVTKGGREDLDVGRLVLGDLGGAAADPVGEAGVLEVLRRELGEGLRIVGGLEVLKGEGVLEDLDVGDGPILNKKR